MTFGYIYSTIESVTKVLGHFLSLWCVLNDSHLEEWVGTLDCVIGPQGDSGDFSSRRSTRVTRNSEDKLVTVTDRLFLKHVGSGVVMVVLPVKLVTGV